MAKPVKAQYAGNDPEYTLQQQILVNKADEARAAGLAAENLRKAALAAGTLGEKIRYALIPAITNRALGAVRNAAGSVAGAPARVFDALTARVTALVSPLGVLQATLSSTSSGFGTLGKAVQVLGATLGPILLPGFALLGAALLTLGDYIHEGLQPVMKEWMVWILSNGIPAIVSFVEALKDAANWARKAWEWVKRNTDVSDLIDSPFKKIREIVKNELGPGATDADVDEAFRRGREGEDPKAVTEDIKGKIAARQGAGGNDAGKPEGGNAAAGILGGAGAAAKPAGPAGGGFAGRLIGNLEKFANELQRSAGPPASFQGLAQVKKSAQLAASNTGTFEATILQRTLEAINVLKEAIAEVKKANMGAN